MISTWLNQYDPEDKVHSKQWLPKVVKDPVKEKASQSGEVLMAKVFLNAEDILLVDFTNRQKTVTFTYYKVISRN